jgi:hypothetical protein
MADVMHIFRDWFGPNNLLMADLYERYAYAFVPDFCSLSRVDFIFNF